MAPENRTRTQKDRGLSALIWGLSILLCLTFLAFAAVGVGFLRTVRTGAAARSEASLEERSAEEITPPPARGTDQPSTGKGSKIPAATPEPTPRVDLPELELNPQSPSEMQVFASIPDVVEAASGSVVGVIQYQREARTGKLTEYGSGSGFIVSSDGYILTTWALVRM